MYKSLFIVLIMFFPQQPIGTEINKKLEVAEIPMQLTSTIEKVSLNFLLHFKKIVFRMANV